MPRCWLMKSEPDVYGYDDLERDGRTAWEGVRNYQARNLMRDGMRPGDRVLFYHSNAAPPGVAGIAEVASEPYPDPTQFDEGSDLHDPKATPEEPRWFLVDVAPVRRLPRLVPLAEIKAAAAPERGPGPDPALADLPLVRRGSRLSVMPVAEAAFDAIVAMAEREPPPDAGRREGAA